MTLVLPAGWCWLATARATQLTASPPVSAGSSTGEVDVLSTYLRKYPKTRTEQQMLIRETFESLRGYCYENTKTIPLMFVLGFYVSLVVARWWGQDNSITTLCHDIILQVGPVQPAALARLLRPDVCGHVPGQQGGHQEQAHEEEHDQVTSHHITSHHIT